LVAHIEGGAQAEGFENRVLRRIFGPKRDKVTERGENYIMRNLMICILHPILFG